MKTAIALGFMSVGLAACAVIYPALRIPIAWASISFAIVAIGYAGVGSRVFAKNSDGRVHWLAKIVLLPYLLYSWLIWHACRLVNREEKFHQISDDLFVGRRLLSKEIPPGFDHYVDLTAEFEDPSVIRSQPSYLSFPILDASTPTADALFRAATTVNEGKTYVHCAQGHGRTGLFSLALLFSRGQIANAEEGLKLLKSNRPALNLNHQQRSFIDNYIANLSQAESPDSQEIGPPKM